MAKKRTVGERLDTPAKRARARLRRLSAKLKPIKLEMMKSDIRPGPQNVDTKGTKETASEGVTRPSRHVITRGRTLSRSAANLR